MKRYILALAFLGICLLVCGCVGDDSVNLHAGPIPTADQIPKPQTLPIADQIPTPQPIPTTGPMPTAQPLPTADPIPTAEPIPTA